MKRISLIFIVGSLFITSSFVFTACAPPPVDSNDLWRPRKHKQQDWTKPLGRARGQSTK